MVVRFACSGPGSLGLVAEVQLVVAAVAVAVVAGVVVVGAEVEVLVRPAAVESVAVIGTMVT